MLPLFVRIIKEHRDNARIKSLVGKILANMAVFESTHRSIFQSGFIGILAGWKQDPNLLVTLPATKALKNLDQTENRVYGPGIYVMLDKHLEESGGVDVVFLHGLLGGVFYSWRQSDPKNIRGWGTTDLISSQDYSYCWPRDWMRDDGMDARGVRIIGVDFETYLSQWGNCCPKESFETSLQDRSLDIYSKLRGCGVGDRPVVFVGHSMGGLIIKKMLTEASLNHDDPFIQNTRGVVFYSTPHYGSEVSREAQLTKHAPQILLLPGCQVDQASQAAVFPIH